MLQKPFRSLAPALLSGLLLSLNLPAEAADEVAELKAMMKKMQERLDQLERNQAVAPSASAEASGRKPRYLEEGELPGSFRLPGSDTSVKIYGHATMHVTRDNLSRSNYGNTGWGGSLFLQSLDGTAAASRTGQTFATARASRIGFMTLTPTESLGNILTKVEGDFDGSQTSWGGETQSNLRLREAYVKAGNLLAGQTYSTFTDLAAMPDLVEWNGTGIAPTIRQAMLRYSVPFGTSRVDLAVENSIGSSWTKAPVADYDTNFDYVARFDHGGDWGHVSVRGVGTQYKSDQNQKWGYGLAASGRINLGARDSVVALLAGGDGIGRYMYNGAVQGAVNTPQEMELWSGWGAHLGYTHKWSDQFRSTLATAYTHFDENAKANAVARSVAAAGPGSDFFPNRSIRQFWANSCYTPYRNFDLGLDYTYGQRETFNNETGSISRLTGMVRYRFE